jgi:hypothetical protein
MSKYGVALLLAERAMAGMLRWVAAYLSLWLNYRAAWGEGRIMHSRSASCSGKSPDKRTEVGSIVGAGDHKIGHLEVGEAW